MADPITPEDWNSHSHQSIYDTAQAFDSSKPNTLAEAYRDASTQLGQDVQVQGKKVQIALAEHWRGQAAQGLQKASTDYFNEVHGYVEKLLKVANALPPVGADMSTAKSSIWPPKCYVTTDDPELSKKIAKEKADDENYARQQMISLFSHPVVEKGKDADIDADPSNPNSNPYQQVSNSGNNNGSNASNSGGSQNQNGQNQNGQTKPAFSEGTADQNGQGQGQGQGGGSGSGSGGSGGGSPSGAGSGGSPFGSGANARDAGYSPYSPAYTPGSTTAAGYSPGTATGTGAPGALRPGLGGIPGPGAGSGTNPAGVGASGIRGGVGGFGGFGMGGMGGAHARGQGEEEEEHEIPQILINLDNGNDLYGDLPKASPGVIGDWSEQERAEKQRRDAEKRRYKSLGWDVKFDDEK